MYSTCYSSSSTPFCPHMSRSLVIEAVLHRLLVLTSYKPHVAHLYNQVTVKPGQRLYMVNQQYPYTVRFTEDTSTPRSAAEPSKPSKRAHGVSSEGNGEKITTSDHHRLSDDSPPPKKTLPSGSDKSVGFIWSGIESFAMKFKCVISLYLHLRSSFVLYWYFCLFLYLKQRFWVG